MLKVINSLNCWQHVCLGHWLGDVWVTKPEVLCCAPGDPGSWHLTSKSGTQSVTYISIDQWASWSIILAHTFYITLGSRHPSQCTGMTAVERFLLCKAYDSHWWAHMWISLSRITYRNHGLVGIAFLGILGAFGYGDRKVGEWLIRDAMQLATSVLTCWPTRL